MINKKEFIEIIDRLKDANDLIHDIKDRISKSKTSLITDFFDISGLIVCHEDIVINLLENMFNDNDMISWWIYELDFGKDYKKGCILDKNGNIIDLSTASKLYDYLIKEEN